MVGMFKDFARAVLQRDVAVEFAFVVARLVRLALIVERARLVQNSCRLRDGRSVGVIQSRW